jgi:uncharacterized protein YlxW (UPF0749 family)
MNTLALSASLAVLLAGAGVAATQAQTTDQTPPSYAQVQQNYQDQQQQYQNSLAKYHDQRAQYEAKRMAYAHENRAYERALDDYDAMHGHGAFVTYYSVHPGEYDRMFGPGAYERDFGQPVYYEDRP